MQMTSVVGQWLEPVITPDVAQRLLALQPNPLVTKRVLELGVKANEGQLSADEESEYESYIAANDIIAILQSTARQVLRRQAS
jgi:hypothetical protein